MSKTTRSIGHRTLKTNLRPRTAIGYLLFGVACVAACGPAGATMDSDGGAVVVPDSSQTKADAGIVVVDAANQPADAGHVPSTSDAGFQPPPANLTCTIAAQCASGFCVDGVCCDNACDGSCESCALTGKIGTCSPITNAADDVCGADSMCDGTGACRKTLGKVCAFSSECGSGNCVDGVCCSSAACGTCQSCALPGSVGVCTAVPRFTDDPNSSPSCSGDHTCDGLGQCRSKNGTACGQDSDCTSLHCVDGVCCDTACDGTCYSCNQQGSAGTCKAIDGDVDVSATTACTGSSICTAHAGATPACKIKDGEACTSSADCLNGSCITSYRDGDKDGYGQARISRCELAPAAGYVLTGGDCCDSDPNTHPGITAASSTANACGGFDRNCDGKVERQDGSSMACGCIGTNVGKFGGGQICTACL